MRGADAGPPPFHDSIRCPFCVKRRDEVEAVVAGRTQAVAICDKCVDLCAEIIAEQRSPTDPPRHPSTS